MLNIKKSTIAMATRVKSEEEKARDRERMKRFYELHPEKRLEYRLRCNTKEKQRACYQANKEKFSEARKRYYRANREKCLERQKRWRELHPEKTRAYAASYYARKVGKDDEEKKAPDLKKVAALFKNKQQAGHLLWLVEHKKSTTK